MNGKNIKYVGYLFAKKLNWNDSLLSAVKSYDQVTDNK